jgi:hypothetical protein
MAKTSNEVKMKFILDTEDASKKLKDLDWQLKRIEANLRLIVNMVDKSEKKLKKHGFDKSRNRK